MCSLKAIIASFFMCSQNIFAGVSKNILMRYLMCSLNIIWLVSIIISSKKKFRDCLFRSLCCGEILSWSSQQVVYRWLCKPAIFQELFHRWLRGLAIFQPLFSSQILQNRFLVIKLFKSLFCNGDWIKLKLKWFKFVNANHTSSSCGEVFSEKLARRSDMHFTEAKYIELLTAKALFRYIIFLTDWEKIDMFLLSLRPSLHFIG